MSRSFLRLCMGVGPPGRKAKNDPTVGHRRLHPEKPAGRPIVKLGSAVLLTHVLPGSSGNCSWHNVKIYLRCGFFRLRLRAVPSTELCENAIDARDRRRGRNGG